MIEEFVQGNWLDIYDYEQPKRGEIRQGVLLEIDEHGAMVDIGLKHDGIVPRQDIDRLADSLLADLKPGQLVMTRVIRAQDQEDSLMLSLSYIQEEKDWERAQELLRDEEFGQGEIVGCNGGGLLVKFGCLNGFIPASHLANAEKQHLPRHERKSGFREYIGQELQFKVIEVDPQANRLVLSERLAEQELREQKREELISTFEEGNIRQGTVTHICDFGAFVDLGEIDGLIHISELAWRRVRHPSEIVEVGQELDVHILDVDEKRKRIGLSLKQLRSNPWEEVEEIYGVGQVIEGKVTNVVDFGAFVALDIGIEGLLHISEIASPEPHDPREFLDRGDKLVLRILRIDAQRQRVELSLKEVSPEEKEMFLARQEALAEDE
jgi:small subunit ribosomal protein S1